MGHGVSLRSDRPCGRACEQTSLMLEAAATDVIKGAAAAATAAPAKAAGSEPDKREQVGVDRFRVGGRHAVREALVGLERSVFQELG